MWVWSGTFSEVGGHEANMCASSCGIWIIRHTITKVSSQET